MGNYTEMFYHFVWATKRREPFITPEVEPVLHDFLRHKCAEMGITVYAVNGMPDHVHVACTVPMTRAHSDFLEKIKGGIVLLRQPQVGVAGQSPNLPAVAIGQRGINLRSS